MTDPASLTVLVATGGLTPTEAVALLTHLPDGASLTATVHQPPLGGRRYQVTVQLLSVQGAADLTGALLEHVRERATA